MQASGETTRAQIISDLLTEPLAEERARLIAAGFPTWNRDDLLHLISAMARHGRTNFSMIAGERHLADRSGASSFLSLFFSFSSSSSSSSSSASSSALSLHDDFDFEFHAIMT